MMASCSPYKQDRICFLVMYALLLASIFQLMLGIDAVRPPVTPILMSKVDKPIYAF